MKVVIGEEELYPVYTLDIPNALTAEWETIRVVPESLYNDFLVNVVEFKRIQLEISKILEE